MRSDEQNLRLVHRLNFYSRDRLSLFNSLAAEKQAQIILQLSRRIQMEIVNNVADKNLLVILEYLDPDEATDILQFLPKRRQHKIIRLLSEDLKKGVKLLADFDPETAAGIMNLDYIQVFENNTFLQVAKKIKKHELRTGKLPAVIVLREGKLIGHVPGHELAFGKPSETIKKYVKKISTVCQNASREEVISIFRDHPHNKITVLGEKNNVLGIIYSDDVIRLMQEQQSASLYDFAGVNREESVTDTAFTKVVFRYKWLIINLGTAFLASFTVGMFNDVISKFVLLAAYMPIVAGMGGNAATQTLAVMVRGITLGQISLKTAWKVVKREVGAGLLNGIINGIIVSIVVVATTGNLKVALVLAMAMIFNLCVAGFFGTIVPLIMKALKKDPATSATIFITTATDILGFMAFLGLASVILP